MPECTIGGQAVLEGVMMRGPSAMGVAVRQPDGAIWTHREEIPPLPAWLGWLRWPFFRGILALVRSLRYGIRALNLSAEVALEGERREQAALAADIDGATSRRERRRRRRLARRLAKEENRRAERQTSGKSGS